MTPAAQRAIEWLNQQISDLNEIRNAAARDPIFKNWRQATLTVMQRIWPGDSPRIERFRRIPFSPVDPRADVRAVREAYSRGCQEAGRVLKKFIEEIEREGVPEGEAAVADVAPTEFEDGFPTVDLPLGESSASKDPAALVDDMMSDVVDLPPQGQDPSSPAPPRLPASVANAAAKPATPTMAERLAQEAAALAAPLSAPPALAHPTAAAAPAPAPPATPVPEAKVTAGAPRKGRNMKSRLKDLLGFAHLSAKALAGFPREGEEPTAAPAPAATPVPTPVVPPTPVIAPPTSTAQPAAVQQPSPEVEAPDTRATRAEVSAMLEAWPPKAPAAGVTPAAAPAAPAPVAPTVEPVAAPEASAPVTPPPTIETDPVFEPSSVVMTRPSTLRGNIEKISIDSLISPQFRDGEAITPAASEPAASAPVDAVIPPVPPAPETEPHVARNMIDDPEFMMDASPSVELPKPSTQMPVPQLAPQATRRGAPASTPHAVAKPTIVPPLPTRAGSEAELETPESATAGGASVDPEEFARAAEDFMKSSPVLGASPRRGARIPHDEHGFGDPDALAVASIVHELGDMGVPEARYAETRARLLDLARRLERGELEWSTLRKAVWFAMEYPELARRLVPVLLPWMDRAA